MTEITKALIKARRKFKTVEFDKTGPRNKYASLKSIIAAVNDALMDEGILFTQNEYIDKDYPFTILETKLIHISGEYLSSRAPIANDEKSPITNENQRYGAALSYARRYSAMTILGLYADEADIDDYDHERSNNDRQEKEDVKPITEPQLKFIQSLIKDKKDPRAMYENLLRKYKIEKLEDLKSKDASDAIKMLQVNP